MGEHGQGGPAVPGAPAPNLVLVEPGQPLGALEGFLDAPALARDGNQGVQGGWPWTVAAQVGVLTGAVVAADQQIVPAGVGVVFGQQADPGPGVVALAVAARSGGVFLPGPAGQLCGESIDADR